MIRKDEITSIGKFLKTHALKGELNAVFDIDPLDLQPQMPLITEMEGIFVPFYMDSIRSKGHFASLVKLHGIDSEEDARQLVNKIIYLRKSDLSLIDDEVGEEGGYADDFVGFVLTDPAQGVIGTVSDVDLSTQNALFIVETPDHHTVYVPVSEEWIEEVDFDNNTIIMSLPDGLLDLNL